MTYGIYQLSKPVLDYISEIHFDFTMQIDYTVLAHLLSIATESERYGGKLLCVVAPVSF